MGKAKGLSSLLRRSALFRARTGRDQDRPRRAGDECVHLSLERGESLRSITQAVCTIWTGTRVASVDARLLAGTLCKPQTMALGSKTIANW
jgi:hypothetical protein